MEKDEKERNKNYRSNLFRSYPMRNRKFNKISKKFKKIKKYDNGSFQAKIGRKKMRKREIKIIVPFRSYPMCNRKVQKKNSKKIQKIKTIPLLPHFKPK